MTTCPPTFTCDNIGHGCFPPRLAFLYDEPEQTEVPTEISQIVGRLAVDAEALFEGFIQGIQIFNGLNSKGCNLDDLHVIRDDIVSIINTLKGMKWDHGATTKILIILAQIEDIYEKTKTLKGPCQEYAKEMEDVLKKVVKFMKSFSYLTELSVHVLTDLSKLESMNHTAVDAYNNGKFEEAGKGFGGVVYEALLWNYPLSLE